MTLVGKFAPDPELTAPFPNWMQPPNLEVVGLEITQVIQCFHNLQCPDNSVPLFSGKLTLVRAYVRFKSPASYFATGIGGALCFGDTGNAGCESPVRPLYKIQVWEDPDPVRYARPQLIYTLDFILPSYFVTGGTTKQITVYVNYNFEDFPKETYYKDNHRMMQYQVETSEPVNIRYHLVQNLNRNHANFPDTKEYLWANPGSVWAVYDFLDLTYPTSEIHMTQGVPLLFRDYDTLPAGTSGCRKGWEEVLSDLLWYRNGQGPIAYGLMPSPTLRGESGCGYYGLLASAGQDTGAGKVAAQEIAHNLNRTHAPGCGAGNTDPNYPAQGLKGSIEEFGADVLHRWLYAPGVNYDYMGYCGGSGNSWTSIYTYEAMAGLLPAGAYLPSAARLASPLALDGEVLIASGEVSPTALSLEHGIYRLPAGSAMTASADFGPYAAEQLDVQGHVLAVRHFTPVHASDAQAGDAGPVNLILPAVDGASTVVFRYQDQEIGRVTASRRAPEVGFTSPSESESWTASGPQAISWTGSDPDGDPLQYLLQYSADGGRSWQVVAPNLTDSSFELDTAWLPGSDHAVLRLVASDGFNTVSIDTAPLQVEGKPPEVHISGPTGDEELFAGAPVVLKGAAIDVEDGFLGDANLSWASDRDDVLGSGRTAVLAGLMEGPRTLTLTAVDSDGNVATASVDVIVQAPQVVEAPTSASAALPLLCLASGIVVGGGALAAAFAIGRRSRRGK